MRYTGPKTRINRRFKMAIFNPTKAFERKPHPPGIHGPTLRRQEKEYSKGLNEKQKLRYKYGLTDKSLRKYLERAKKMQGVTGENLIRLLEMRLDNVVYSMGLAKSRQAARQFVCHGHVVVNGQKVTIPSYSCKSGDEIVVRQKTSSRQLATSNIESAQARVVPPWISITHEGIGALVMRNPISSEMEQSMNIQLIVEFYSR